MEKTGFRESALGEKSFKGGKEPGPWCKGNFRLWIMENQNNPSWRIISKSCKKSYMSLVNKPRSVEKNSRRMVPAIRGGLSIHTKKKNKTKTPPTTMPFGGKEWRKLWRVTWSSEKGKA